MYLSSYEYDEFSKPRKILSLNKEQVKDRQVYKALVDRPILGQDYGWAGEKIDNLYLVGRFKDNFDSNTFPFEVHVFIPKPNHIGKVNALDQLQNIGWASIYDNEKDAIEHKI